MRVKCLIVFLTICELACSHSRKGEAPAAPEQVEKTEPADLSLAEETIPWNRFPLDRLAEEDARVWAPRDVKLPPAEVVQNVRGRYYGLRWIQQSELIPEYVKSGDIYVAYLEQGDGNANDLLADGVPMHEVGFVVRNGNGRGESVFPDEPEDKLCRLTFPRSASGCSWPNSAHFLRFVLPEHEKKPDQAGQQFANLARQLYLQAKAPDALSQGERLLLLSAWRLEGAPRPHRGATLSEDILFASEIPAMIIAASRGFWPVRAYGLSQLANLMRKSKITFGQSEPSSADLGQRILAKLNHNVMSTTSDSKDVEKVSSYLEKLAHVEMYENPQAIAGGKYDSIVGGAIFPFNYVRDALETGESTVGRLHYVGTHTVQEPSPSPQVASAPFGQGYVDFLMLSPEDPAFLAPTVGAPVPQNERFSNRAADP